MRALSVIIPAYNEEEGIVSVVERLRHLPLELEIIVVDDGSTDATGKHARAAGATVLRHPANGGYGLSLKTGIRAARHDLLAITDADGTYPVEEIPALIAKMDEGFDMAVGARHGREYRGTFLKMPARLLFTFLVEFSVGRRVPDINSGLRVFRKTDIEPLFPHLCDVFSFTTTLTLAYCFLHKFVCYVPISYGKRIGRSKVRMVRDSLRTLQYIVESIASFNPLKLFLLLSLLLLVLATALVIIGGVLHEGAYAFAALATLLTATLTFALGVVAALLQRRR